MEGSQADELHLLWQCWKKEQSRKTKERLVKASLSLVEKVIKQFFETPLMDQQDMKSVALIGLLEAIEMYDPSRGASLETYATWRMRGAILDELRRLDWVPRGKREQAKRVEQAYTHLEQEHLRHVSDEEVASYLGLEVRELQQLLADTANFSLLALEGSWDKVQEHTLVETLPDESQPEPIQYLYEQEVRDLLAFCIARLPEKERIVLTLYYFEELTPKEISEVMNLSMSRISQLHSKSIFRLRGMLSKKKSVFYNP